MFTKWIKWLLRRRNQPQAAGKLRPLTSRMSKAEYQEFRRFSKAWVKGEESLWK
jgi:hypothetical protein